MHKLEMDVFNNLVTAIESASVKYAEWKRKQLETERNGYMSLAFGNPHNVSKTPPSPMSVDPKFLGFIQQIHVSVWVDLVYTMCGDNNRVSVNRADLQNLLDYTESTKEALFGSHQILSRQLKHQEHFSKMLHKAREEGTHW